MILLLDGQALLLQHCDPASADLGAYCFQPQGCAQGSISANWGDGFSTNPAEFPAGSRGSPINFFTALLDKPYG